MSFLARIHVALLSCLLFSSSSWALLSSTTTPTTTTTTTTIPALPWASLRQCPRQEQERRDKNPVGEQRKVQFKFQSSFLQATFEQEQEKECDPCARLLLQQQQDENGIDVELDRREAFFSLLGMAWAAGALPAALLTEVEPAYAVYGADAKMELPNPVQGLTDRTTKQCLVESLGTRECLVYADPDHAVVYQGADGAQLLARVNAAAASLATVPALVQAKKWSQVTGVLTGPLGELVRTMNQLVELSSSSSSLSDETRGVAKQKVTQVKNDLYAIAAAVDRKQVDAALQSHAAATKHLVDFVKAL